MNIPPIIAHIFITKFMNDSLRTSNLTLRGEKSNLNLKEGKFLLL